MPEDMVNPTQPAESVSGYFEGEGLELAWRFAYRAEHILLLMEYLGAGSGMRILDVGCGTGFLSRLLAETYHDVQVVGVDLDRTLLEMGRELLKREQLSRRVELREADAYQLPFPSATFDLVTSHTLL